MLVDVDAKPKSTDIINVKCYNCGSISSNVFIEHIRKVNNQSKHTYYYHCSTCYRQLDSFKKNASVKTSNYIKNNKEAHSARSKNNWLKDEYRSKMKINSDKLSNSVEFSDKLSESMKIKFVEDVDYINKIKKARLNYYADSSFNPRTLSRDEFVNRAKTIHGDMYDYSKLVYVNFKTKVEIICKKHGSFFSLPSGHLRSKNGCPKCNTEKMVSIKECELFDYIKSVYNGKIEQSNRTVFNGLEIDIWIPDLKLGVEYHGAYFHSFNKNESTYHRNYHSMKSTLAYKSNINLLQFVDLDFNKRPEVAKSMINNKLGLSRKIYARECSVEKNINCYDFFNDNHFSGFVASDVNYSLIHNGNIVCVLSLKNRGSYFEIMRFSNLINTCVIGGFSKLMKAFIKDVKPNAIFTYVDRSFSTGDTCYSKFGMNLVGITRPGYRYWKNNKLFNRIIFQKHKLQSLLDVYDPSLTESDNMFNNGYRRLWDSGNLRYHLKVV